jgi:adenylate cyclase
VLPSPLLQKQAFADQPIRTPCFAGYTANLEELQKSAAGAGHFNPITDADGIIRRVPMLVEYDGAYYEPLSLAMVRVLLGSPPVRAVVPDRQLTPGSYPGLEWLVVGPLRIPVDDTASALVPYRGSQGSFRYIPVVDVLNEHLEVAELKAKIVLVGTTARALFDLRATPVEPVYPGVEIHANLIAGILDGTIKHRPPYVLAAEFMLLLLSGLAMALLLPLLSPLISTLTTVAVLSAVIAVNVAVYHYGNVVLPLASGLVMILVLFTLNMAYGFFVEARGMRQIKGLFEQYVPPELVEEMARDPEQYDMEPRAADLTILFADVRSFTTISEALEPEVLRDYINEYLTVMSAIIRNRHRGTLDKYIGDAIMAFWGAPVADPQHARNGVLAALDMQKECRVLNEKFAARGWPTLTIGVGVNSGNVRVGDMGSNVRRAYTAMGDAVNIASRLEGITKDYGADIIIGEGTRRLLSGFAVREIDRVRVKGKDEPVTIYEPLGLEGQVDQARQDEVNLWNQALRLYRQQDWDRAEVELLNLRRRAPDRVLYARFLDHIAHHRSHPPGADWDGAWTFETK